MRKEHSENKRLRLSLWNIVSTGVLISISVYIWPYVLQRNVISRINSICKKEYGAEAIEDSFFEKTKLVKLNVGMASDERVRELTLTLPFVKAVEIYLVTPSTMKDAKRSMQYFKERQVECFIDP